MAVQLAAIFGSAGKALSAVAKSATKMVSSMAKSMTSTITKTATNATRASSQIIQKSTSIPKNASNFEIKTFEPKTSNIRDFQQEVKLPESLQKNVNDYLQQSNTARIFESFKRMSSREKIETLKNMYETYKEGREIYIQLRENNYSDEKLNHSLEAQKTNIQIAKEFLRNIVKQQYHSKETPYSEPSVRALDGIKLVKLIAENFAREKQGRELVPQSAIQEVSLAKGLERLINPVPRSTHLKDFDMNRKYG